MTPIEVLKIIVILLGVAGILVAIKWYNKDLAPTPSATPTTASPEKEKPAKSEKKEGDGGWTKFTKFVIETAKMLIYVSILVLVLFTVVRGFQWLRSYEPPKATNSTTRTIRLSTQWSIPVSDYWGLGWEFKVDPPTTGGIYVRFIQGDEIVIEKFVGPKENNADISPPPGISELQMMLNKEEPLTHEAKVWNR